MTDLLDSTGAGSLPADTFETPAGPQIRTNIFPWADLQALSVPEVYAHLVKDVIPVLAVMSGQGPAGAKLLNADAIGNLLTNLAGGPVTFATSAYLGSDPTFNVLNPTRLAVGMQVMVGPSPASGQGTITGPMTVTKINGNTVSLLGAASGAVIGVGSAIFAALPSVVANNAAVTVQNTALVVNPTDTFATANQRGTAFANPVANTAATITVALVATKSHVLKSLIASLTTVAAFVGPARVNVVVRAGATGVGTITWQEDLCVPNTVGAADRIVVPNMTLVNQVSTALTVEFTAAGGASTFEKVIIEWETL